MSRLARGWRLDRSRGKLVYWYCKEGRGHRLVWRGKIMCYRYGPTPGRA